MDERGGWCITIEADDQTRLFMVANKDLEEAKNLALARAGGGSISTFAEVSEPEIANLNMSANDVEESLEIGRG